MKNIMFIIKRDLRNITKNKAALIVVLAVALLPSLYAWVNIKASWDPYSNTKGVSVAVVSNDKGATVQEKDFNIGDSVIVSLTKNDSLGWQFVSEDEAIKGVKHGDYYAAIVIPEDFSENMGSVTTRTIEQPVLEYYINEKVNAISPKITGQGASGIVENIQQEFIEEANNAVITVFNDLGIEIENNLTNIERVRDIVFELEEAIPDIYSDLNLIDKGLDLADVSIDRVGDSLDNVDTMHANAKRLNERLVQKIADNEQSVESALHSISSNLASAQSAFKEVPRLTSDFSKKEEDLDRLVNSLRDKQGKIDDANARLDDIYDFLKEQDTTLKNSMKIKDLQAQLAESMDDLTTLKNSLEEMIVNLKDEKHPAVEVINTTQELSNKIAADIERLKEQYDTVFYPQTKKAIEDLQSVSSRMKEFLQDANTTNDTLLKAVQRLIDLGESTDFEAIQTELDTISTTLEGQLSQVKVLAMLLKGAGAITGNDNIIALEKRFSELEAQLELAKKAVDSIQIAIDKGQAPSSRLIEQLKKRLEDNKKRIEGINEFFNTRVDRALAESIDRLNELDASMQQRFKELEQTKNDIDKRLDELLAQAKNPKKTISVLEGMVSSLHRGISSVEGLDEGLGRLQSFIDSDKITNEIETIKTIQGELVNTKGSVDTVISRIQETKADGKRHLANIDRLAERMDRSVGDVISYVNGDLSRHYKSTMRDATNALYDVSSVLDDVQSKLPRVRESLVKADDGVATGREKLDLAYEYFPEARDTVENLANKIRSLEKEGDLNELIDLLKTDPTGIGQFLANPIQLKNHELYPIPNYGSAMSPFYTTLSLWVGALLLVSSLQVDIAEKLRFRSQEVYVGRLVLFAGLGAIQATVVTLGNVFLLNTYVVNKLPFILSGIVISIVFVTIVYTLVSVFGNTGKVFSIILMVMQLGGSGGTFPVQMAPEFFQKIHAFLPFTHAITLLRESIGGAIWEIVWKQVIYLLIYFVIAIVFGLLAKQFFNKSSDKFMAKAKKSGLII